MCEMQAHTHPPGCFVWEPSLGVLWLYSESEQVSEPCGGGERKGERRAGQQMLAVGLDCVVVSQKRG